MPVTFSYNLDGHESVDNNRIQSMFERFGWQGVGGSSYRYPPLGRDAANLEDWMNNVVPPLMLFRAYVLKRRLGVSGFSLDAHSSTGYNGRTGTTPWGRPALGEPGNGSFGLANLEAWLDAVTEAVPY
jgi:hypothetical protein